MEEYSVAAHVSFRPIDISDKLINLATFKIYKLSQSSLAELARNSVIQSGFEMEVKRHWLGQKWYLPGSAGNDINRVSYHSTQILSKHVLNVDTVTQTNVPDFRLEFRHQLLMKELEMIRSGELTDL